MLAVCIPTAFLAAWIAAEKFKDFILFEIPAVETEHTLNIGNHQCLINRLKLSAIAQQIPRLINGNVFNFTPFILRIVRGKHKTETGMINRVFNCIRKA